MMVDPALKEQILHDLEQLTVEEQRQVAEYTHTLVEATSELPPAPLGRDLRHQAGILDADSAREMREVIEAECERIEPDEW